MKYLESYLNFIIENVSSGKMRIYYSNKFRDILNTISIRHRDDNRVANFLIHMEDSNQALDSSTLIDVTDKNDMISFIQVNRIKRKIPQAGETLGWTITDKSKDSEFWKEGRTEVSIGRWLRRVVKDVHKSSISDSDVEKFVNQYKSVYDGGSNPDFEIVSGEDIKKWYLESNYEINKGQLGNSCMRYNKCQDYLDIYVKNPEVCNLLILKSIVDPGKIRGRALIWKLKDGSFYQDRIYTNYDSDTLLFNKWVEENGIKYKYGDSIRKSLEVQLGDFEYQKYPYMDTFLCYNPENKMLSDDEDLWPGKGYIKIQETNGGYASGDLVWSEYYNEYIDRDSAVLCNTGNRYNPTDWISREEAVYLEYKDEWWLPSDDITWSEYHQDSFHIDDVIWSDLMKDYLHTESENVIKVRVDHFGNEDYVVKSRTDLYISIDDEYFYRDNYIKDPYTGEYRFKDETIDGISYDKYLEGKIQDELGIEDVDDAKRRLKEIYKKGSYDKSAILYELENNKIFKERLIDVYWGLNKEDLPNKEDMIGVLFTKMLENIYLHSSTFSDTLADIDPVISKKFLKWRSVGMTLPMNRMCNSINYSQFGEEVYKIYLFINL